MTNQEPIITINGTKVSDALSMTIRCAIESFDHSLRIDGLGDDDHGKSMVNSYRSNIDEIRTLIHSLKSCPLCGGEAKVFQSSPQTFGHGETTDNIGIKCIECGLEVSDTNYTNYLKEERVEAATIKWNSRI